MAGLATFLVVLLHKPFDALTVTLLMSESPRTRPYRHLANVVIALLVPVGVLMIYGGLISAGDQRNVVLGCTLAFAAGNFLCIAMSDLLPEIQFHEHDRVILSIALLVGVGLAALIGTLEGANHGRSHSHEPPGAHEHEEHADHEHDGHQHDDHEHELESQEPDGHDHEGTHIDGPWPRRAVVADESSRSRATRRQLR
ncbi:MAG: ZIP family metal transporter [Pirellulales bacterium]